MFAILSNWVPILNALALKSYGCESYGHWSCLMILVILLDCGIKPFLLRHVHRSPIETFRYKKAEARPIYFIRCWFLMNWLYSQNPVKALHVSEASDLLGIFGKLATNGAIETMSVNIFSCFKSFNFPQYF